MIVPHSVSRSPDAFYKLLVDQKVTVLNQTPSAFAPLMEVEQTGGEGAGALRLRYVIFGGEALNVRTLQPWFDRHGDRQPQLVNMYGITETTVHVTYRPLTSQDLHQTASPIGCPIPDLDVYLLDPHGQPVPTGAPGEMFVGGAGVARGYLNRPELTAARFVVRTLREGRPSRFYRTGDLARWLADGSLEFLGRLDDQVKLRGFRIELGEIAAVLSQCPGVAQSVVVLREDRPGDKRLVAYYVPGERNSLPQAELTRHVREKLPEYMVPSAFVSLERLPLTPNGKVDRRALPPPARARPDLETGYVAPRTTLEERVAAIWADILGLERVGVHDNFFDLGGHSLLATRVMSQVCSALQVEMPVRSLFDAPTIAGLAENIGGRGGNPKRPSWSPCGLSRERKTCRSRLPRNGCGSWPSWSQRTLPTICPMRCGCAGRWTWTCCCEASRRSSGGMKSCAPCSKRGKGRRSRWSARRRHSPCGSKICATWSRTSAPRG